jgi:hypothetical protein
VAKSVCFQESVSGNKNWGNKNTPLAYNKLAMTLSKIYGIINGTYLRQAMQEQVTYLQWNGGTVL